MELLIQWPPLLHHLHLLLLIFVQQELLQQSLQTLQTSLGLVPELMEELLQVALLQDNTRSPLMEMEEVVILQQVRLFRTILLSEPFQLLPTQTIHGMVGLQLLLEELKLPLLLR